jgi:hypothetical protein
MKIHRMSDPRTRRDPFATLGDSIGISTRIEEGLLVFDPPTNEPPVTAELVRRIYEEEF